MPERNQTDLKQLELSLDKLNATNDRHILLLGDFNCPDINWSNCTVDAKSDRAIQQNLVDLSANFNFTQVQEKPTRLDNNLDLVFTTNPSLIKKIHL